MTDDVLGTVKEITLPQGRLRYREYGEGPVLVFIHGALVNSTLWRKVIPGLAGRFRCIAPDLPLGGHSITMPPDFEMTPPGVADLVATFLDALDLRDVTLVGNDTGGAICQLVVVRHPERLGRLVLTNCDAYEAFFPVPFQPLQYAARLFGVSFVNFFAWTLRSRLMQRMLVATVSHSKLDEATLDAYFGPLLTSPEVRRDTARFLAAVSNRYTLEAARFFPSFRQPVMIIWGRNDLFFSRRLAERLQQAFPAATLEFVAGSRAFVPEDQPEQLARRIAAFVDEHGHPRAQQFGATATTA